MRSPSTRGSALLLVMVVLVLLIGMSGAYLGVISSHHASALRDREGELAFVNAESAVDSALYELNAGKDAAGDGLGAVRGKLNGGTYKVSIEPAFRGPGRYVLRAVGRRGKTGRGVVAVVGPAAASADRFASAVFGDLFVELRQNASVDSFDSRDGDYGSSATNRLRNQAYAGKQGTVKSNGSVTVGANAKVFGEAVAGPEGRVRVQGSGYVDGATTRAIAGESMPPVEVPAVPLQGDRTVPEAGKLVLPAGEHHVGTLVVERGGTLRIEGPATLVVDRLAVEAFASLVIDGTAGPVTIFGTGSFEVDSKAQWVSTTRSPAELSLRLAGDNIVDSACSIKLNGGGEFFGTIYAPNAKLSVESAMKIYGAIAARAVTLGQGVEVHYDQALRPVSSEPAFRLLSWEEVAVGPPAPSGGGGDDDDD